MFCLGDLMFEDWAEKSISSTHFTPSHDTSFAFDHEFDIYTADGSSGFGRNRLKYANATERLQWQKKVHVSAKMQNISNLSVCLPICDSLGGCCRVVGRIGNWIQRILQCLKSSVQFLAVFPGLQLNGDFYHLFWPTHRALNLRVML